MSASMAEGIAELLADHTLDAVVYLVSTHEFLCICGKKSADHAAHQADALAANGYGKLEDAWDEGNDSYDFRPNPYRRPE